MSQCIGAALTHLAIGTNTERVALAGVVELKVQPPPEAVLTIASSLTPPVLVGRRLGLDASDAEWLRNVLTARRAAARP